ncbi:LrgB family protein [Mammaliicoccus vitulinus]|uniref:LrgB family protein n=1 Tax=Mammaliicoccus vitulinus TaxID=71237 RepID=UPI000E68A9E5|nr:LrgB family protein [Mammaliicoccus vitulinus]QTN11033.1 LrgB family protein [Mammaliicoccus vitulinus]RIN17700.1 LrgB family protein [Mammaliicoccus vitulinus]
MIIKTITMILLTLGCFIIAKKLQLKYNHPMLNPALISSIMIVSVLLILGFNYTDYMTGGSWIHQFLDCSVVSLAFPLYKYRKLIVANFKIIISSVLTGIMVNFIVIYAALYVMGYPSSTIVTVLPRSMTAAVGIEVSHQMGGTDTITVMLIIATGLIGSILGNFYISKARFKSDLAKGLTYGNASHAFGTAKALETNLQAGAFSTIGMILTAVLSAILLPFLYLMMTYI